MKTKKVEGRLLHKKFKIKESVLRKMIRDVIKEESDYQNFFTATLKKFGVKSPNELGNKKRKFFNYIDKYWDAGSNETDIDETLEFPSFHKKRSLQRTKAQKRDQILKISEGKRQLIEGDEYHVAGYYDNKSGPDSLRTRYGPRSFEQAYNDAKKLLSRKKKDREWGETIGYISVSGVGNKFAILFIDSDYIKARNSSDFRTNVRYVVWKDVAKQVLSTGKPATGEYPMGL